VFEFYWKHPANHFSCSSKQRSIVPYSERANEVDVCPVRYRVLQQISVSVTSFTYTRQDLAFVPFSFLRLCLVCAGNRGPVRGVSVLWWGPATEGASLCQMGKQGFNIKASVYRPVVCKFVEFVKEVVEESFDIDFGETAKVAEVGVVCRRNATFWKRHAR
jgi:hypothetical protein